ncbi:MAG: LPXTG cell wall anchor domain-containing protein [Oscillospiraceae bacterium]|nr:LPXTG cell wall anchor domain-containing protein [Oscillospiraceae bacterium]
MGDLLASDRDGDDFVFTNIPLGAPQTSDSNNMFAAIAGMFGALLGGTALKFKKKDKKDKSNE